MQQLPFPVLTDNKKIFSFQNSEFPRQRETSYQREYRLSRFNLRSKMEIKDVKKEVDDAMDCMDSWLRESAEQEAEDVKPKVEYVHIKSEASESEGCTSDDDDGGYGKEEKYIQEEDAMKVNEPTVPKHEKRPRNVRNESSGDGQKTKSSVPRKADVSESAATGLCTFTCTVCNNSEKNWDQFVKHMRENHKKVIEFANAKNYLTKVTIHICRMCSEEVLCESNHMSIHLNGRHRMKVTEYRKKYKCKLDWKEKYENTQ